MNLRTGIFKWNIDDIAVAFIENFPAIQYWQVPYQIVQEWWTTGQLGTTTKISREKALNLLKRIFNVR